MEFQLSRNCYLSQGELVEKLLQMLFSCLVLKCSSNFSRHHFFFLSFWTYPFTLRRNPPSEDKRPLGNVNVSGEKTRNPILHFIKNLLSPLLMVHFSRAWMSIPGTRTGCQSSPSPGYSRSVSGYERKMLKSCHAS